MVRNAAGSLFGLAYGDALGKPTCSSDEPVAVLGHGAASSGDSDSIACLAGAFAVPPSA